jgi:zinc transporter 14
MTVRQAMVYNFLSACTCYLGLFLGIMVGEMHMGNQYIFAAAGGMFLYIALVDMVPEMNATMDQMSKIGVRNAMLVFLLQNIGILSGIVSLFVLAKFQDDIHIEL